jgi:signal transduction histidine kinase
MGSVGPTSPPAQPDRAARDELATARRHARALLAAVVAVDDEDDLRILLGRVVRAACVLSDAGWGALGVLDPDGRVGEPVTHGTPPPVRERAPGRSALAVPVRARDEVLGVLSLAGKRDGADFTADDAELVGSLAAAAGTAIENARLHRAGRHRQRWLEASVEVEQQLLAGMPRSAALALVCDRAHALARADLVAVLLPDGRDDLVVRAASGPAARAMAGARVPVGRSVSGSVVRSGVAEGVRDFATDHRVATIRGAPPLGPARVVPMTARGHVLGVLVVGRRPGAPPLTPEDGALVDAFARQAAIALELADLQEQRRGLAVARDRERIARDLHDLVIQRIYGTGLTVRSMRPRLDADLRVVGDEVVAELDAAIRELRSAIFALERTPGTVGLRGRLVDTCRAAAPALGREPRLRLEGPLDTVVPDDVAGHLASVLGEALTNVARHAAAGSVDVRVHARTDRVELRVDDDGSGPPPDPVPRGNGLRNMRSRATELGGTLTLTARPGGGTRLRWAVPLGSAASRPRG